MVCYGHSTALRLRRDQRTYSSSRCLCDSTIVSGGWGRCLCPE